MAWNVYGEPGRIAPKRYRYDDPIYDDEDLRPSPIAPARSPLGLSPERAKAPKAPKATEQDLLFEAIRRRKEEWDARQALERPQYQIPQEYTPAGSGESREAFSMGMSPTSGIYMTEKPREGFAGAYSNVGSEQIKEQNPYEALEMEYLIDKAYSDEKATPEQDELWQTHYTEIFNGLISEPPVNEETGKPMTSNEAMEIAKAEANEKFGGLRSGAESDVRKSLTGALGRRSTAKAPGDYRSRGMDIKTGEITESAYISDAVKKYRAATPAKQKEFLEKLPLMGLSERETKRLMTAIKPVKPAKVKKTVYKRPPVPTEKEKGNMTLGKLYEENVVNRVWGYLKSILAAQTQKSPTFSASPIGLSNQLYNTKVSDLKKTVTRMLSMAGLGRDMIALAWKDISKELGKSTAQAKTKKQTVKPFGRVSGTRG